IFFLSAILFFIVIGIVVKIFIRINITTARDEEPLVESEPVKVTTPDNVVLQGLFIKGKKAGGKTIVFCHEVGAGRGSWHKYASYLPDAGYNVFTFDFRGHGASLSNNGYKPNQWISSYDLCDLKAVIKYLTTRDDVDPSNIGLFGISRGGGAAVCTAANMQDNIRAIVCDSAFSTYETMVDYIIRWTSVFLFIKKLPSFVNHILAMSALIASRIILKHDLPRMEKYLRKLKSVPVFFIHGERDNYILVDQSRRLYKIANEPKQLWNVHKARHNEAVLVEPQIYKEKVLNFLDKYMG
ncbi:alpha/beta fold hydrolase, partial [bacterium]|nr:alpha/beta fold hydrolase [bacterium]